MSKKETAKQFGLGIAIVIVGNALIIGSAWLLDRVLNRSIYPNLD